MATKNKAIYAKKWRKIHNQNHQLGQFTIEYLKCKHPGILGKIDQLFHTINVKHPTKRKLTKTPEFLIWKNENVAMESTENATENVTTTENVPAAAAVESTENATENVTTTENVPAAAAMESTENSTKNVTTTENVPAAAAMESTENSTENVTTTEKVPAASAMESIEIMASDLELGATDVVYNGDPWLNSPFDDEIRELIEELREDPDLRSIMDMIEHQF